MLDAMVQDFERATGRRMRCRRTRGFDRATIERLTSPNNYLGFAPEMVDRVLASAKR
jgi:hypothetical protein